MTQTTWPDATWIYRALDELGLRYAARHTPHGVPDAGLALATEAADDVAVTVLAEEGTLRLTAHDVAAPLTPDELHRGNGRLPLARAYVGDTGSVEVAIGCFVGHKALRSDTVGDLLAHLVDSRREVLHPGSGLVLPPMEAVGDPGPVDVPDLDAAPWCRVAATVESDGWITVDAAHVPDLTLTRRPDATATFDRLQLWTRAGKFVVVDDDAVRVQVRTPVVRDDLAERVGWSTSQATLMLQVGASHLGG